MGCRMEGPFIAHKTTADIISDGIGLWGCSGTQSRKADRTPFRQTDDRRIRQDRHSASVDIPKLVQRKTEHKIRFREISVEEAQELMIEETKELNRLRTQIHQPCKEVLDCRL